MGKVWWRALAAACILVGGACSSESDAPTATSPTRPTVSDLQATFQERLAAYPVIAGQLDSNPNWAAMSICSGDAWIDGVPVGAELAPDLALAAVEWKCPAALAGLQQAIEWAQNPTIQKLDRMWEITPPTLKAELCQSIRLLGIDASTDIFVEGDPSADREQARAWVADKKTNGC